MSAIRHLVLFRYRDSVDEATRREVLRRFRRLAEECVRDGRRYVRSIEGGPQTSPEAAGTAWHHGFVVTFDGADDRDHYVGAGETADAAHAAFSRFVAPLLADVAVMDVAVSDGAA